jgi:hypothetical protein
VSSVSDVGRDRASTEEVRMPRLAGVVPVTVVALACALTGESPALAGTSAGPSIVATPSSVMVNTTTTLRGSNFSPSKTIKIEECAVSLWYVLQNPCDVTVKARTNAQGGFKVRLTVHACQSGSVPGFSETCYVGEPSLYGVDTTKLEGAASITVTGP